jgi:hypothetical protein
VLYIDYFPLLCVQDTWLALGVDLKLSSNSEVRKPFCPDGIKAHAKIVALATQHHFNISRV